MASNFMQGGIAHYLGSGNFNSDTLKMMLLKNTYTPNKDHDAVSDINAHECDATGYTGGFNGAGRKTLSSPAVTLDDTNDRAVLGSADPGTWTSIGGATNNTLRYGAPIKEITSDALSIVLAVLDMGSDKTTNGGDLTVQIAAAGIGYISC
jgi:hypothetical protein